MILLPLNRAALLAGVCLAAVSGTPLSAQEEAQQLPAPSPPPTTDQVQPDEEQPAGSGGEIVVEAQRLRGQLDVEQEPLLELDEEAIAAEGVASIADLITQIEARTGSARGRGSGGRPITLVNGIRVGSFREFANYPPEALQRVEVFPEEVALRFGFPPDRRVINLILKDQYQNAEVELEFEGPTRGGFFQNEQEIGYLRIQDGGRFNANFEASDTSLLTESERDILQTPGSEPTVEGDPDPAEFRSLVNDSRSIEGDLSWAKAFIDSATAVSANLSYQRNDNRGLSGLNTVLLTDPDGNSELRTFGEETPLERRIDSDFFATSGSVTKPVRAFRFTSTFNATLFESETEIDQPFDTTQLIEDAANGDLAIDGDLPSNAAAGIDIARNRSLFASSLTTLRGPVANLPGGEVLATFDAGYNWTNLTSSDTRTDQETDLTRGNLTTGMNLVVPITSRRNGFADALGSFTLNANLGLDHLSDFGTLGDYTLGLSWKPFDNLDLSATRIQREVAPSLGELGNPEVQFFNVPVFDFTNGETVLATVTTGGNPDLPAETQRDWRFAANWEVPFIQGMRFTVEYILNRSDDVTSTFPLITPEIEAAFPDRITRDADGTLVAVDQRPVSYAETRSERLQFTLSKRGNFGQPQQQGRGGPRGAGGGQRGGPPSAGGRPPSAGAAPAASATAGAQAAGGAPTGRPGGAGQREQFMAFRARLCADDGLEWVTRLIEAAESGDEMPAEFAGFDTSRLERMLSRIRAEDGSIDSDRLAGFRERLCSMDPSMMGGRRGSAQGGPPGGARGVPPGSGAGAGGPPAGRPAEPSSEGGSEFEAFRTRLCGDDGLAVIKDLVAKIEAGEDVSESLPGLDPEFIKFGLDQARGEDGKVPDSALEQFRQQICASPTGSRAGAASGRRSGGGPAFNPLARAGGNNGWFYFVNLTHTIELENEILFAPGLEPLDQLDGDATNAFGLPRHNTRLEAGLFGNGMGMRLSGRYTGETRLNGSGLPGSSDLFFDDLVRFDLRMFANLDQITGQSEGVLKNVRVSLRADNIFDAQRTVTDENGDTPINYQPFVIDPVGRFVGIDLRKLF